MSNNEHDEIWFVIDTDDWNVGGKINKLKDYCNAKVENTFKVFMAQSNRSFEIWQCYHHFQFPPNEKEIGQFLTFIEYLHSKIPGGFNPNSMSILIVEAIENTRLHIPVYNLPLVR
ncbi:hypothetical protein HP439_05570 [Sphingobacterium shayense]|uniref:RloB domain-containing protein n=1 Tax=Sphingobacterium shayense TaxID=626343 RepID=UPI0015536C96|nr:RloB domain-containing protein [Sphingobacterium shayense]NQD70187.1 hypothetical protein [Sphingobacterium shayense]